MTMKLIITSGGTTEPIDAVRGITNHSTGQLGKLITERFLQYHHDVTLVTTKTATQPLPNEHLRIIEVETVNDLMAALKDQVPHHDILIHSMAVSDYTPVYMTDLEQVSQADNLNCFLCEHNSEPKISSASDYQVLFLKKTPKVISYVKQWNPNIKLVGFKLLVNVPQEELIKVARASLAKNHADYILANDLVDIQTGMHKALLISNNEVASADTKEAIADLLYERMTKHD
ncbi:TPA: phosphopantothenate--cysteine ligase [Streptococcus pyogenes]|nr:phosphopantothenate--cysteine ligase [Streptococcus pyogenes]HER4682722.1 phosphopantothenate--cysteine ligase [Streptococcus pyogenes NGAS358]HER4693237.1 phosphopantothenate--cysteine ligase [Streptococcus pyogenes NGAS367]VGU11651.1 phosphopantothenate--cysteine ligase [Streptococcus pyogenes]HEP1280565.1 phosphopantothenate--cysteine ligase [Streptococcus pyogenes]